MVSVESMKADNLVLVMENCEELVIPWQNLTAPFRGYIQGRG